MNSYEPKKLIILHILEILSEYSDKDHRLKQTDIIRLLNIRYGIECERKAISRNIDNLREAGYEIDSNRHGSYLVTRQFELCELRLLIDGIIANRNVCVKYSREIIDKLLSGRSKYEREEMRYTRCLDDFNKVGSCDYLYVIDELQTAIASGVKVEYAHIAYGKDKQLHVTEKRKISPYQLVVNNGRYYVVCCVDDSDKLKYFRVDRMSDIKLLKEEVIPLKSIMNNLSSFSIAEETNKLPYLFSGEKEVVTFEIVGEWMIDHVIDWFGKDITIIEKNGKINITVKTNVKAMHYWLLQYGAYTIAKSPKKLVDMIKSDMQTMIENYNL